MSSNRAELGLMEVSCVREMANIGLGHATTAIAEMTGMPFQMSLPDAKSIDIESIPLMLGGREELTVGIYMAVDGDVGGHMAFLFPWHSARFFWRTLIGQEPETVADVGELEASVMLEIGNVMNSSFLNAISDMASIPMHATPPMLAVEMSAAILQSIVLEASDTDNCALAIETKIFNHQEAAEGYFLFLPSLGGLRKLFAALGVPEAA